MGIITRLVGGRITGPDTTDFINAFFFLNFSVMQQIKLKLEKSGKQTGVFD